MALHSIDFNLYPTNWLNVKFSTEIYAYISLFLFLFYASSFFQILLFHLILEAGCALLLTYSLYTTPKTSFFSYGFQFSLVNIFWSCLRSCYTRPFNIKSHKLSHSNCLNVKLSSGSKKERKEHLKQNY